MIVVIDGYNLLRAIFPKVKGKLDKQRDQLIRQLGYYKRQRENKVREIVLVFDGGLVSRATRDVLGGVTVVFSGHKQSADDWIVEYVDRNREKELVLVTRDRELIAKCKTRKVEVIKGVDFYEVMQSRIVEEIGENLYKAEGGTIKKYEREERPNPALDMLMAQVVVDTYEKEDVGPTLGETGGRGKSRTLSKEEKKRESKLKKL